MKKSEGPSAVQSPLCADAEALAQALGDLGVSAGDTRGL